MPRRRRVVWKAERARASWPWRQRKVTRYASNWSSWASSSLIAGMRAPTLNAPGSFTQARRLSRVLRTAPAPSVERSEEHTSELQSHSDLVCRLLLEKKKKTKYKH